MSLCVYCGAEATTDILVEPGEVKAVKGVKTVIHFERRAVACAACARVDRESPPEPNVARAKRAAATRRWKEAQERMKRSPLLRKSSLGRSSSPTRVSSMKPTRISPASPEQRAKVKGSSCVNCGGGPCDPAHLTSRAQGGCDHADCVAPLCRQCHRLFDEGRIDLEPVLALGEFSEERSHMAGHLTLRQCIRRLNGMVA